jgi:hypothetical protein
MAFGTHCIISSHICFLTLRTTIVITKLDKLPFSTKRPVAKVENYEAFP